MNTDDKMNIRDLNGEEIAFLLRYRTMSKEDKEKFKKLMEEIKTNNSNEK